MLDLLFPTDQRTAGRPWLWLWLWLLGGFGSLVAFGSLMVLVRILALALD